jgi:hypothetical protein
MRIAAEPADRWLRIEWDDGVRIVATDEPEDDELATGPRGETKQDILEALDGKRGTGAAIARLIGKDPKDGTFWRALKDLVAGDKLLLEDGKYRKVPVPTTGVGTVALGTLSNGASAGASGGSVAPDVAPKRGRSRS